MRVVIVGAGGHGKVVLDALRAAGVHEPVGFIDADPALTGAVVGGLAVLGTINQLPRLRSQRLAGVVVAIGENRTRRHYATHLHEQGWRLLNAIHPAASVSASAKLGHNVFVAAGAIICAEARLADSVIVNTGAIVDHECEVGDSAHICPGARLAGRVRVGAEAFVGIGASVIQCLEIGEAAIVGAGAAVIADVPAHATAVGVPATVIKIRTARPALSVAGAE